MELSEKPLVSAAEEKLAHDNLDEISRVKAEARLYRALVRINSAKH